MTRPPVCTDCDVQDRQNIADLGGHAAGMSGGVAGTTPSVRSGTGAAEEPGDRK
ncbi:VENN motif pre-toxin domain-containing protein [Streptomyces vinaceus]